MLEGRSGLVKQQLRKEKKKSLILNKTHRTILTVWEVLEKR